MVSVSIDSNEIYVRRVQRPRLMFSFIDGQIKALNINLQWFWGSSPSYTYFINSATKWYLLTISTQKNMNTTT